MTDGPRRVTAGRVGKPHGFDGSFYVEGASHALPEGTEVELGGRRARVERRGGMDSRPLVRLSGLDAREAVSALRGKRLLVAGELADDEWLAEDLVGCEVRGLGLVRRVMEAPTCAPPRRWGPGRSTTPPTEAG